MNTSQSLLSSAGPREIVGQYPERTGSGCVVKMAKRPYQAAAEAGLSLAAMVRNGFERGLS